MVGQMPTTETTTWRFLFGFYRFEEALTIARSQGLELSPEADRDLQAKLSRAVSCIGKESGQSVPHVNVGPVSPTQDQYLAELAADPTFAESIQGMSAWHWGNVELSGLRTFQPSVNWEYIQKLVPTAPAPRDQDGTVKFCLPKRGSAPPQRVLTGFNPVTNTFSIVSEHLDFRVVGQVQGEDPNTKRNFFGFVVGFGLPTLTVAHYRGNYLLKNGYHRAVALLAKGHSTAPALVVEAETLQMTGALGPGFFTTDILGSARPPVLGDFLSNAAVDIQRPKLRTVVSIRAEAQQLSV
jgi:hypothetical protein